MVQYSLNNEKSFFQAATLKSSIAMQYYSRVLFHFISQNISFWREKPLEWQILLAVSGMSTAHKDMWKSNSGMCSADKKIRQWHRCNLSVIPKILC